MPNYVILVTGASSGFGQASCRGAGQGGSCRLRLDAGRRGPQRLPRSPSTPSGVRKNSADLRTVELDVQSDASVDAAVKRVIADAGRLDVIVHNAGHMVFGPLEAFTTEQLAEQYDVNVLGTHRLNRAALPHMRARGQGLLVWVGSTSTRGGTPPYLGPYFAAKAGMDSLAVTYAGELARWNIETTIIVPGSFTTGTNHFSNAGKPSDAARAAEYENGPYAGVADKALKGLAGLSPPDADPGEVARQIVRVVEMPFGKRPFRVHIDPARDGAEEVNAVADRMRREMYRDIGLADLLSPHAAHGRLSGSGT